MGIKYPTRPIAGMSIVPVAVCMNIMMAMIAPANFIQTSQLLWLISGGTLSLGWQIFVRLIMSGNSKHINNKHPYYSAPEQWMVVEWIRLNYGIWIYPYCAGNNKFHYGVANSVTGSIITNSYRRNGNKLESLFAGYSSPQEATSAAFDYVLKELI